jgi:hypothetical protein
MNVSGGGMKCRNRVQGLPTDVILRHPVRGPAYFSSDPSLKCHDFHKQIQPTNLNISGTIQWPAKLGSNHYEWTIKRRTRLGLRSRRSAPQRAASRPGEERKPGEREQPQSH